MKYFVKTCACTKTGVILKTPDGISVTPACAHCGTDYRQATDTCGDKTGGHGATVIRDAPDDDVVE